MTAASLPAPVLLLAAVVQGLDVPYVVVWWPCVGERKKIRSSTRSRQVRGENGTAFASAPAKRASEASRSSARSRQVRGEFAGRFRVPPLGWPEKESSMSTKPSHVYDPSSRRMIRVESNPPPARKRRKPPAPRSRPVTNIKKIRKEVSRRKKT